MQVTVLVIVYRGREHITLHDNHKQASRALIDFVDARWTDRFGSSCNPASDMNDERIKLFFAEDGDLYIFGEADISELSAHVTAAVGD